ncbi:MAG TPA: GNAT family N-acetyltransferase [Bryobacteraceae bacterium]|nr:GNAT family N-acetyltransferase [Bryobacteraceae bacterium]
MTAMSGAAQSPSLQIRRADPDDAEVCGRILYSAFEGINRAHGFAPELPDVGAGIGVLSMLFSSPSFYCVVAEEDGRVVGSNCLDERSPVAGLGPISVDPSAQNRGIGRALMTALLDRVREREFAGVRLLQSAFHTRSLSLYAKLGFEVREPIAVMSGLPTVKTMEGFRVRPALESDIEACSSLCGHIHGFARTAELRDAIALGAARVVERQDRLTGYACGFGYFGQAVAESTDDLKALIASAEEVGGPGILVPLRNAELFRWCLDNGMRVFIPLTLMTIGVYEDPRGAYLPSILY